MSKKTFHCCPLLISAILLAIVFSGEVFAQQGRSGRFSNRGGVLGILSSATVQEKLEITDEQARKLDEVRDASRPPENVISPLFEKLSQAKTDEERNSVRMELSAIGEQARAEAEKQLPNILTEEQQSLLLAELVAVAGGEALMDSFVQTQFELTADQVAKLKELNENAMQSRQGQDMRDASVREQFRNKLETQVVNVLTESQQTRWNHLREQNRLANADSDANSDDSPNVAQSAPGRPADNQTTNMPKATTADNDSPVASFETESPTGSRAGNPEEQKLSFNFRYAPWSEVLKQFAEFANLTLDLNETPPGTFNYLDSRKYTPTEALDVINGYLLQKGYVLVRRDQFLVCLNIDDGIPPNLVPNIAVDELAERGQNELLNVVFPISGVPADNVAREVEMLLGPQGKVVPLSTSNSLVVTDIGSNLRRIDRLLTTLTVGGVGDAVFKSYTLKFLSPREAEGVVKSQLGIATGSQSVSSAYEDWRRDRDRGGDRDSRESSRPTTQSANGAKVFADIRTNSLLVTATPQQQRIVEDVLKATDVEGNKGAYEELRHTQPYLEVYTLHNSDPQEVVKTIDVLMPGVVVNEDGRNDKIHVNAPRAVQDEVRALIQQLDGEGSQGGSAVTVIPLSSLDPYNAAATLRSLFIADEEDAPVIEADSYGRRLLIRGSQAQITQIKTVLADLGEDGTGNGQSYMDGPVRTIPLGGRDPDEIVPILQRLWESSGDTPIRIVPASPGMIIEKRSLGTLEEGDDDTSKAETRGDEVTAIGRDHNRSTSANFTISDDVPSHAPTPSAVSADGETSAIDHEPAKTEREKLEPGQSESEQAEPEKTPSSDAPVEAETPVVVTVQGGSLVITSEDETALNRMEDLVDRLGQVIPPRTKWSVFYLRSADATETAMLLEQIFPTSSVSMTSTDSSLFSPFSQGFSYMGDTLMGATGLDSMAMDTQSLRIIPDLRSNSLFVSGAPDKVAEVEQVLKVLDSTELPDSLRDRLPRMIDVRHADVEEVATIVREVYKDYLEPSNAAAVGNNPLAMLMMGGGRGGDRDGDRRNQPQGAIRLTVGVDKATSKLIVSADDALFQQVKELVETLDTAQLEAKRTVQVVTLQNADATLVSNTLGSLIPKVRTSSTSDRRQTSSDSRSDSSNSSQSSNDNSSEEQERQERIRRFMEMRSRFGGDSGDRGRSWGGGDSDRGRGDRGDRGDSSRFFGRGR